MKRQHLVGVTAMDRSFMFLRKIDTQKNVAKGMKQKMLAVLSVRDFFTKEQSCTFHSWLVQSPVASTLDFLCGENPNCLESESAQGEIK